MWFSSTTLGDDKDNVLIRSNGVPGYLAADIAYHYDKLVRRGFDRVIDVWGADHQGHVSRMKAAVQAIGVEPDRLTIIIHQLVTLREGGEVVKLSKRTGKIIALADVIEEVGRDACRFLFLARAPESQMEFDLDLARQQSLENPVYYVQYAHARTASILDLARQRGVDWAEGSHPGPRDPGAPRGAGPGPPAPALPGDRLRRRGAAAAAPPDPLRPGARAQRLRLLPRLPGAALRAHPGRPAPRGLGRPACAWWRRPGRCCTTCSP